MTEQQPKRDPQEVQAALSELWLEENFETLQTVFEKEGLRSTLRLALSQFLGDLFSSTEDQIPPM